MEIVTLHILPTDKSILNHKKGSVCRYIYNNRKNQPLILSANDCFESGSHYQFYNIYITSDEEIKEGNKSLLFVEGFKPMILTHFEPIEEGYEGKKIILTTDQDLIKDGVQAIDDEFLEWFIKNSSCEEVEVEPLMAGFIDDEPSYYENMYKIIIPKEEPKYPIGGFAPGYYTCRCVSCKETFYGDKRAVQCEPCALGIKKNNK